MNSCIDLVHGVLQSLFICYFGHIMRKALANVCGMKGLLNHTSCFLSRKWQEMPVIGGAIPLSYLKDVVYSPNKVFSQGVIITMVMSSQVYFNTCAV